MRARRGAAALAVAVVAAVGLAACGDDGDTAATPDATGTPGATTTSPPVTSMSDDGLESVVTDAERLADDIDTDLAVDDAAVDGR